MTTQQPMLDDDHAPHGRWAQSVTHSQVLGYRGIGKRLCPSGPVHLVYSALPPPSWHLCLVTFFAAWKAIFQPLANGRWWKWSHSNGREREADLSGRLWKDAAKISARHNFSTGKQCQCTAGHDKADDERCRHWMLLFIGKRTPVQYLQWETVEKKNILAII